MLKNRTKKRYVSIILALILTITSFTVSKPADASVVNEFIKVDEFIKYLITESGLSVSDNTLKSAYIDTALRYGILKEGDFKDYKAYLTRTDCAVIANRLDEYFNFKYNYNPKVYEFLKDCNYFEGKLYYSTEGILYPKGATKDTYPASQFLEEVISPIIETTFKCDDWASLGLNVDYKYIYDSNDNVSERYIEIGVNSGEKNDLRKRPFNDDSYIIQAWKKCIEGDRKETAVLEKRISDIKMISESKREAVASVVAKGIMTGYSNGMYVQNRSFKGSSKITVTDAEDAVQKVLHPEKRTLVSPDGQQIRTTNLPKNADKFPYILECFPNDFYESKFEMYFYSDFKDGSMKKSYYAYPNETTQKYLEDNFFKGYYLDIDKSYFYTHDKMISQAEKYLNTALNVDYRTVDKKWVKTLESSFAPIEEGREGYINHYVTEMKKNHVVVESKLISVEPSTLYFFLDHLYVRAYVKYRITADKLDVDQDKLIYGDCNNMIGLKNGKWRYGYYDIRISMLTAYGVYLGYFEGVDTLVSIDDMNYRGNN